MRNPFKHPRRKAQFNRAIRAYTEQHPIFFFDNGDRNRLSSFSAAFWAGYDGVVGGLYHQDNRGYRETGSYVFYSAGRACAKEDCHA